MAKHALLRDLLLVARASAIHHVGPVHHRDVAPSLDAPITFCFSEHGLCAREEEARDLLVAGRHVARWSDVDEVRRKHQFQPELVVLGHRSFPGVLDVCICAISGDWISGLGGQMLADGKRLKTATARVQRRRDNNMNGVHEPE